MRLTPFTLFGLTSLCCTAALAQPVSIDGPQGKLVGQLSAAVEARDIVVIVPGSGPTDRDGNSLQMGLRSDTYRLLADGLRAAGVSSIRVDKRGFYDSAAAISDPNDVTIAAYAQDVRQWVARASQEASCVWLAGHSEGGLVALAAAAQAPAGLCGVMLLAAPGRPVGRLMVEQFKGNPAAAPMMPELEALVGDLEQRRTRDPETISPMLRPLFSAGLQRYMTDLFSYDPAQVARRWRGPALIVQGEADVQVRPQDAALLAAAMPQASLVVVPGATHMLKADVPGQPFATYTDPKLPLHPAVVPAIVDSIRAR